MSDRDSARGHEMRTPLLGRRHVLIGGALALASGVAFARQPTMHRAAVDKERFEQWVPAAVGAWSMIGSSGVVLPPPDALSDRLYDNLVTRTYAAPDRPPIMLLLAYNNTQDGVLQLHRPEVCYPVGGYELTETQDIGLPAAGRTIPASFFTAVGRDRTEHVAYFTRLGSAFPRSWLEQRMAVARLNLSGWIPDGMLMRVSLLGPDASAALPLLSEFTRAFIGKAPSPLRTLLIG